MSELKIISPILDNLAVGGSISDHHGIRCYPAMDQTTSGKYIVKVISIPASRTQLDAFLLSGAYADEESALTYFKEQADEIVKEAELLEKLSQLEGYFAFEKVQLVPSEDEVGVQVYLLGNYKHTLERTMQKQPMTYLGAVNLGLDLCAALTVCRRCGYMYVDLKPGNIYVTENNGYHIGDLGFLRLDSLKFASLPDKYRSAYTAPEISDAFSSLNTTMDVYAVGMILYQIYNNGELPVFDLESSEPLPAPANADYEMSEIILKACAVNPDDRWEDPAAMGQALVSYMQRNGANDTPIVPPAVPIVAEPEFEQEPQEEISYEADPECTVTETSTEFEAAVEINESGPELQDDELNMISSLLLPGNDETAPEYNEIAISYNEVSDEINEILTQADEIVIHPVPEPVIAPEPIDVPMPDPIVAESEEDQHSGNDEENVDTEASNTAEDQIATSEDTDTSEETAPVIEETVEDQFTDEETVVSSTPESGDPVIVDEAVSEPELAAEPPKKKKANWPLYIILALLLIGIIIVGVYFYKNYYLLPVDSMTVVGKEDHVTITVETPIDESLITVVCKDQHGDVLTAPLKNGMVTFNDLNADTAYIITLDVAGFHKLSGDVTKGYSTPKMTEITAFDVYTAGSNGLVNVIFSVSGKDADSWKLTYSTIGGPSNTVTLQGKNETISGLTVGKEYTFTLEAVGDMYLTGKSSLTHTVREPAYAQHLTVTGYKDGEMHVAWVPPKDIEPCDWTIHCVDDNNTALDSVTVSAGAETKAIIKGINPTGTYTVTAIAEGMQNGVSETVDVSSVALENIQTTVTANSILITWDEPEDHSEWTITCTADGLEIAEPVTTATGRYEIHGLIPNTTYCITIKQDGDQVPLGGIQAFNTPKAEDFSCTYEGVTVTAEDFTANLCAPGNVKGKWTSNCFTSTFKVGDEAGILIQKDKKHGYSQEVYTRVFAIYDANGSLINTSYTTNEWYLMWPNGNTCELDIPAMPTSAGEYTLHVYFNGQLVTTQQFTITE